MSVKTEVTEAEKEAPPAAPTDAIAKKKKVVFVATGIAAALVLVGIAVLAFVLLRKPAEPPAPPVAAKAKAAPSVAKAPAPKTEPAAPAAPTAAPATTSPGTPSTTLNEVAQIPAKAIGKAQSAIEARRASGQTRVDAATAGEDLADKPAVAAPGPTPKGPVTQAATGVRSVTKGVSATAPLDAVADASPEFRSFVANAKISGVFQGTPARAFINGRMARSGEVVDPALGIVFEGVDPVKRHLLFKDKSGAVVARKY
ncbi:MAG: hypothetical protein FJ399_18485 [Verrucomicrobia bacterium]|nr:hypothetical protein [Verrucomicrobiota bacterium]